MPARRKPEALKALCGTRRRDRVTVAMFRPVPGPVEAPEWLEGRALLLFRERAKRAELIGLDAAGCTGVLAQYCALTAWMESEISAGIPLKPAALRLHLRLARDFYETPKTL